MCYRRCRTGATIRGIGAAWDVVLLIATLVAGCDESSLVAPDPPWSSSNCYDARRHYPTTGSWELKHSPSWPSLGGSVSSADGKESINYAKLDGKVLSDTYRGWQFPDSRETHALVLTDVRIDGKPSSDVAVEFLHYGLSTCPFIDMRGQRVSLESSKRAPWEDVYEDGGGGAVVIRNADGQLLWAELGGSLLEHSDEAVPELRTTQLPSGSAVKRYPCEDKTGKDTKTYEQQVARVRLSSLSESKVFDEQHRVQSISIGCVEYLASVFAVDVVSSQGCYRSQYIYTLQIIRRALLSPSCAP